MKKLLLFVTATLTIWAVWGHSATGQSHPGPGKQTPDSTLVPVNTSGLPVLKLRDTAIVRPGRGLVKAGSKKNFRITCGCGINPHAPAAIYIDGKLVDNSVLSALSPKEIISLRILKSDSTEIDGKIYEGVIAVETKDGVVL